MSAKKKQADTIIVVARTAANNQHSKLHPQCSLSRGCKGLRKKDQLLK